MKKEPHQKKTTNFPLIFSVENDYIQPPFLPSSPLVFFFTKHPSLALLCLTTYCRL